MGLYPIDCPQCKQPFMWFSGGTSADQRCGDCKAGRAIIVPLNKEAVVAAIKNLDGVQARADEDHPTQPQGKVAREWNMCDICHLSFKTFNTVISKGDYDSVCRENERLAASEAMTREFDLAKHELIQRLRPERDALVASFDILNKRYCESEDRLSALAAELAETKEKLSILTGAYSGLMEEFKSVSAERGILQADLEACKVACEVLKRERDEANAIVSQACERIERLERALAMAKEKLCDVAPSQTHYQTFLDKLLKLERGE